MPVGLRLRLRQRRLAATPIGGQCALALQPPRPGSSWAAAAAIALADGLRAIDPEPVAGGLIEAIDTLLLAGHQAEER